MRIALPVAVVALALALTGCAPNTDTAYKHCYDTLTFGLRIDDTLSTDDVITKAIEIAETCEASAKANPAAFNAKWGD